MSQASAVERHFGELLQLTPQERDRYLDRLRAEDGQLSRQLAELLEAHGQAGSFLGGSAGVAETQAESDEAIGRTIGPYKLLQQIGEGGMGTVYMAEQMEPVTRTVALKLIRAGMDSKQVVARFEAERQSLALMDHPNIARVLDAGATEDGQPYFVMELVKGIPITEYCDANRLPTNERIRLMLGVCSAVQHAHQKGIIHRDLKPSNILVAQYDDRPVPKVIDFGVAKATHQKLTEKTLFTQLGQIVGTLEYMSPEQAVLNQLDVDTRSDIYSLGVILYELLVGETPLDGMSLSREGLEQILRIIREQEPARPSLRLSSQGKAAHQTAAYRKTDQASLSRTLRGDLDWIVMKALEKDRSRRYETANQFAADLQRLLNDEPVEARPPSVAYRFQKFARRNRVPVGIGGLLLSTLLVAAITSTWFWSQAKEQNAQLKLTLDKYQDEVFHRLLERTLLGDRLDDAMLDLEMPRAYRHVLEGMSARNRGSFHLAVDHLQTATKLHPENVAFQAMLVYAEAMLGTDDELPSRMDGLLSRKLVTPLDKLFVGNALTFSDTERAIELVKESLSERNSVYGHFFLAEQYGQQAAIKNDPKAARQALDQARAVYTIDSDNAPFLAILCLAMQLNIRMNQMSGVKDEALIEEALVLAHRMREFQDYNMGHHLSAGIFLVLGEEDLAEESFDLAAQGGRGFYAISQAAMKTMLGKYQDAHEILRASATDSAVNLAAYAETVALDPDAPREQLIGLWKQLRSKKRPSGNWNRSWILPETIQAFAESVEASRQSSVARIESGNYANKW